ncbi:U3 small nucleolar RNA-associated protein 5 [Klebsormidium nitens]|uniref:U3 small nucleolar RNA-associated protein 5 n=1 Tax=Klebsormidium nitens TaxID=105231 RepID=A0A1Y1IL79_KLENI|nr:U3 small nucleolar RNA-associated protein 5 [Klebsormidium nitens]|eukprot:GAQ91423.1 U3 small nucleolar RNA-associated protein 5 [Klebsormidium nitens]
MDSSGAAPLEGLLAAFSPEGDTLAVTSGDGRIKTWDVSSGRLRADLAAGDATITKAAAGTPGGLGLHISALTWGQGPAAKAAKKKKARAPPPLIAAASSTGDVLAWDAALGELRWRTTAVHAGPVGALAAGPQGAVVYTGGADGRVCQLAAATGALLAQDRLERHGVAALAVSPDGARLLVASARIRLVDLASKRKLRKLAGHAGRVRALAYTPDGAYGLSAAAGDRHVALWDLSDERSDGGVQPAAALLAMEEPAVAVSCAAGPAHRGVTIVALAQNGDAYVWRGEGGLGAAAAAPTRIRSGGQRSAAESSGAVLAACALEGGSVLLAHGSAASPSFETVPASRLVGGQVTLSPPLQNGLLEDGATPAARTSREAGTPAVVGPDSGGGGVSAVLHERDAGRAGKQGRKKRRAEDEAGAAGAEPATRAEWEGGGGGRGGGGAEEKEETLGERVAALELAGAAGGSGRQDEVAGGAAGSSAPRAHSLQVLLTQALASQDGQLLEKCLAVGDEKVIGNTVRRLRASDAAALLASLTAKLQARPSRGMTLLPWIRAALLQHAGTLMAAPGAQPSLLALHQLIDARLAVFPPLLALSGRLDLMMAQVAAFSDAHHGSGGASALDAGTAVYEEGHSDEEGDAEGVVEEVGDMETSDSDAAGGAEDEETGDWETDDEDDDEDDDDNDEGP